MALIQEPIATSGVTCPSSEYQSTHTAPLKSVSTYFCPFPRNIGAYLPLTRHRTDGPSQRRVPVEPLWRHWRRLSLHQLPSPHLLRDGDGCPRIPFSLLLSPGAFLETSPEIHSAYLGTFSNAEGRTMGFSRQD